MRPMLSIRDSISLDEITPDRHFLIKSSRVDVSVFISSIATINGIHVNHNLKFLLPPRLPLITSANKNNHHQTPINIGFSDSISYHLLTSVRNLTKLRDMKKRQPNTVRVGNALISFRASAELINAVDLLAARQGESRGIVLRRLIRADMINTGLIKPIA